MTQFVLLILILCLFVCVSFQIFRGMRSRGTLLPYHQTICMTIKDKSNIPSYIYEQYNTYAPEYSLVVYDDEECLQFLKSHYGDPYVHKFLSIRKGPHRADFFRYAYLYKMGGVYLDVKTILIKPLREVFPRDDMCYMVLSINNGSIYNGIICTPPQNPFIHVLLEQMLENPSLDQEENHYLQNTFQAFDSLKKMKGMHPPLPGFNRIEGAPDTVLFVEKNMHDPSFKKDRYGFNVFALDVDGTPLIKIRDVNYTENYE